MLAANFDGTLAAPTITQPNSDVLFVFGNIPTTGDNDNTDNAFIVQVVARVVNVVGNVSGVVLTNTGLLTYTNPVAGIITVSGGSQGIRVIEPNVLIGKSVQAPRNPVGAGDIVTWTLAITNTGTSPAHDLVITDVLPAGITFLATQSFTVSNATTTTDMNTPGVTNLAYSVLHLDPSAPPSFASPRASQTTSAQTLP